MTRPDDWMWPMDEREFLAQQFEQHRTRLRAVAYRMHDMFAVPFDEIAPIVDRSPEAARQLASRARRRVQGDRAATWRCGRRSSTARSARSPSATGGRSRSRASRSGTEGSSRWTSSPTPARLSRLDLTILG
jgi:hypothetical protein